MVQLHVEDKVLPFHAIQATSDTMSSCTSCMRSLHKDGYALLEGLFDAKCLDKLQERMSELVSHCDASCASVFSTTKQAKLSKDAYFLESADRISFFFEEKALDREGCLKVEKSQAINKVGHALHDLDPIFRDFSRSERMKELCRSVGFRRPVPVQSMYICKQPGIGGEVVPHQDSSFLYTSPPSVMGIWIALEDATLENGCLWVLPGSHVGPIARRFVRKGEWVGFEEEQVSSESMDLDKYVPLEAKRGTVILLHGQLWHFSRENTSAASRHAYTMHVVESDGALWSADNWLQRNDRLPFEPLYDDSAATSMGILA